MFHTISEFKENIFLIAFLYYNLRFITKIISFHDSAANKRELFVFVNKKKTFEEDAIKCILPITKVVGIHSHTKTNYKNRIREDQNHNENLSTSETQFFRTYYNNNHVFILVNGVRMFATTFIRISENIFLRVESNYYVFILMSLFDLVRVTWSTTTV